MVDGVEPTAPPVRCPAISHPETGLADPADFTPLLVRLDDPAEVAQAEEFPRGTLQPDGRLDLCKQGVGPLLTHQLARAAARSAHTRHLLLGTNGLGDDGAQAVADALAPGHRIETLYLGCNRINPTGVAALADRLAADQVVRALWLKRNPIGDEGVLRLCDALADNRGLRTLDLVNVGVTVRGLSRLAETLAARDARLERLFLGGNGLGPESVPALTALIHDAGVHELYLAANHLGDTGVTTLAESATGLPMTLGLGGNSITPVGVAALASRLSDWVSLDLARPPSERALGAYGNVVGDEGAAALAAALPGSSLRRLDLRRTEITGRGAKLLLDALEGHPTLEYLGLNGGVPRRMRRRATAALQPADRALTPAHPDLRAIASVYR
ncbi:gala protein [Micromonospora sp. NPDC003197]